jgi:hypothetical protein
VEKGRVTVRDSLTESKPAQEDGESGQETIEEVQGPDSPDADETKQGTLLSPRGRRLQATNR